MTDPGLVVGWREWVRLPDLLPDPADAIKAKIDTGARTSALHAWDIEPERRDGEQWLRFTLHPRQNNDEYVVPAAARLVEEREVRSSNGDVEIRPVIETTVALGGTTFPIEFTLTNRDQMSFRMLLGRSALAQRVLVDPEASFRLGRRRPRSGGFVLHKREG